MRSLRNRGAPRRPPLSRDAAPFFWRVGLLIHRYLFLKRLSADISENVMASR